MVYPRQGGKRHIANLVRARERANARREVMGRFLLGRCRQAVPVLFGVTLITFLLTHVALGDPARAMMGQRADPEMVARIRAEYGLDKPLWSRYPLYMGKLLVGDLGYSYRQGRPVSHVVAERLPATVRLAVAAMMVAVILGIAAGTIAAMRHNTMWDLLMMTISLLGISVPVFWLGMMLILFFAVWLGWLPISGYGDGALNLQGPHGWGGSPRLGRGVTGFETGESPQQTDETPINRDARSFFDHSGIPAKYPKRQGPSGS